MSAAPDAAGSLRSAGPVDAAPLDGRPCDVVDPTTEAVIATVHHAGVEEVDAAVARAVVAQRRWAALEPAARAGALRAFAAAVADDAEHLADLEVAEAGHPVAQARWEAGNVVDLLTYCAAMPERLFGRQIPVAGGVDITFAEPVGVVGVIVPWNFPLPIAAWGLAPALAAGNAVVLKPAETTPLTALRLADLALAAGLPQGLLTVLPGDGPVVGQRLVEHPDVREVVFTGSSAVGRRVMAGCAAHVKRVTLELGGKSANVVFADADLERAAAAALSGAFDNTGQDCCARSRLLVAAEVHDRFVEMLAPVLDAVVVGDPREPATTMGPLISAAHRARVASYVGDDADVLLRGSVPDGPGFWFPPTVLAAARGDRVAREEVFGPVLAVLPFTDEADAVALANDSPYGLSGSIWTRDVGRALRVARAVQAGNLSVNSNSSVRHTTPFGGFKASGLGRELGPDAALAFTETKNVFIATD